MHLKKDSVDMFTGVKGRDMLSFSGVLLSGSKVKNVLVHFTDGSVSTPILVSRYERFHLFRAGHVCTTVFFKTVGFLLDSMSLSERLVWAPLQSTRLTFNYWFKHFRSSHPCQALVNSQSH